MDSTTSIPDQRGPYEYYPLETTGQALLPHEYEIVVNRQSGQAMLIDWEMREVRAETHFSPVEIPLVHLMLDKWPSYVEYEKCLRVLFSSNHSRAEQFMECIDLARQMKNNAMLDVILQPLRTVLHLCNEHLQVFGVTIAAVYGNGYLLKKHQERDQ
jgi:hypothetical protein